MINDGIEGGVTTVVGPVSVENTDFRDGRIPFLFTEVVLTEGDIIGIHGETVVPDKGFKFRTAQLAEAVQHGNFGRNLILRAQGLRLVQCSLTGLDGVDDILLDFGELLV